jgi:hypothetical protein
VKPKPPGQHGNSKSPCWKYFGQLCDADGKVIDEDRIYCSLCLEMQHAMGDRGHLSQVTNYAAGTSSGNMGQHLSAKHEVSTNSEDKNRKILGYLKKHDNATSSITATSDHEVARDVALWFCRDLMPFEAIGKNGLVGFFAKNVPHLHLPKSNTLANTSLDDVYQAISSAVKQKLANVNSICIMFDGWTDRYKARPYLGVRLSFLDDWNYKVFTLGCHVLPSHTSRAVADHVNYLLKKFFPDPKKLYLTSCHDGAANMIKASKLLKVDSFQHCAAHALHLLLMTDSINNVEDVTDILHRCRAIVTALHFKSVMVEDEVASTNDKKVIEDLDQKMADVSNMLEVDDQYTASIPDEEEEKMQPSHRHASLKAACPTRWNSTLQMVESIVQLQREVQNALKRSGHLNMCLQEDEVDFLSQLVEFLTPFKNFTDLFSFTMPSLSIIPMMKIKIKKNCTIKPTEDPKITAIKRMVLAKLDQRFPITPNIQLHQLLDPATKSLLPRQEATQILENAIKAAADRNLIAQQVQPCMTMETSCDEDDSESKAKRMRMEMVSELQTMTQDNEDSQVLADIV